MRTDHARPVTPFTIPVSQLGKRELYRRRALAQAGSDSLGEDTMRRSAATLGLSGAFLFALGNTGCAQQVNSETLLGGHENPPVISTGSSGTFRALQLDVVD